MDYWVPEVVSPQQPITAVAFRTGTAVLVAMNSTYSDGQTCYTAAYNTELAEPSPDVFDFARMFPAAGCLSGKRKNKGIDTAHLHPFFQMKN